MYLNKLILKNFKKYRDAEVEFQDGLTGIVGPNGAGKSTIVEAIAWALYGKKVSTIKKDQLRNVNADESDTVEVQLSMGIISGQDLTIRRSMKGKSRKTDATLFRDGTMIAY
ncbi:MAG: AAA family ATPase, partial [Methanothrix sp.]|nr:AAA family ATPase [Methanothrix sp.]